MTEEERPEAKEQEACFAAIRETVQRLSRLMDTAYQQYSQLVEQVVKDRITGEQEIERIMDGLMDFGDNPRLLELYKPSAAMSITNTPLLWESTLPSSGSSLRKRRMGIRILRRWKHESAGDQALHQLAGRWNTETSTALHL